ncbi:tumor necrosis factor ligand superfamily member 13B isoform X2 [Engystomops pustulosus]|uniref:tumor necrosis factor ligand superfamily member 13B isoform X2 n=1 Tax=Engystomops pustulosus TaxID=76066 RepID=UPI003AFA8AD6
MTAVNYRPPINEQKRIHFCCYHYSKGVLLWVLLPVIIFLLSSLSAVLLYNIFALKAELTNLKDELRSFKKVDRYQHYSTNVFENKPSKAHPTWGEDLQRDKSSEVQKEESLLQNTRSRRHASDSKDSHSCLQLIPDKTKNSENQGDNTIIPWILSLKHGTSIEESQNKMLIKESGLFFIYGQVTADTSTQVLKTPPSFPEEHTPNSARGTDSERQLSINVAKQPHVWLQAEEKSEGPEIGSLSYLSASSLKP